MCACVCTSGESAYTAWPHGPARAQVWDLTTRAHSEGSVQRKLRGPKEMLPSPPGCPSPSPQHTLPRVQAGRRGTDQGLQDGVVGGVHAGVQWEGALPITVIGGVALGGDDPILR